MKEVITTPDGMKLTAQYRAVYQDRRMKAEKKCMAVWNPKRTGQSMAAQQLFDTYKEALTELGKMIWKLNHRKAGVETTVCNGIGIDLVVDEQTAKDGEIVYWEIQKRWVSDWEVLETAETNAVSA